jgi:hypothetical protein
MPVSELVAIGWLVVLVCATAEILIQLSKEQSLGIFKHFILLRFMTITQLTVKSHPVAEFISTDRLGEAK